MRPRWRSWAPWIALGAVVVVALVVLVARSSPSHSPAARASRIAHDLKCPDCQGESVANSNTATAVAIRQNIRTRIAAGQTDAQIYAYYDSRYPDSRMSPSGNGVDLLVWVLPVIAVLAGLVAIGFAVRRWSHQPRLAASAEDEQLVARARATGAPESSP